MAEKATIPLFTDAKIIGSVGYDAGSEVPVYTKSYSTVGTFNAASYDLKAGDSCALVRYSTAQRSVKNHPIFLFNYHHSVVSDPSGATDALLTAQKTALTTYATAWVTGFSDGSVTHHRCGPNGHVATGVLVDPWIRHRDFPSG